MRCVKNKVSRAASHVNGHAHPVRRTSRHSPCDRPAVEPLPAPCALPGGLIYTDAAAYGAPQPAARPADRPRRPYTADRVAKAGQGFDGPSAGGAGGAHR
jgi:hypothetical protein